MTITYIITKTQVRNDGYSYPVTTVLCVTTSKEVADKEFKRITSRVDPHPLFKDVSIETGDEVTSIYRLHKELMG